MQIIFDMKLLNEEIDKAEGHLEELQTRIKNQQNVSDAELYRAEGEAIALARLKKKIEEN